MDFPYYALVSISFFNSTALSTLLYYIVHPIWLRFLVPAYGRQTPSNFGCYLLMPSWFMDGNRMVKGGQQSSTEWSKGDSSNDSTSDTSHRVFEPALTSPTSQQAWWGVPGWWLRMLFFGVYFTQFRDRLSNSKIRSKRSDKCVPCSAIEFLSEC